MTLEDYHKNFQQEIISNAGSDHNFSISALVEQVCTLISEQGIMPDIEAQVNYKFSAKGYAVDAWAWDEERGQLTLIVADYRDASTIESISNEELQKGFKRLSKFADACRNDAFVAGLEEAMPVVPLVHFVNKHRDDIKKTSFILVTNARVSSCVQELPQDCEVWDIQRLYELETSGRERESIEVDFTIYERKGIPCLNASTGDTQLQSYLLVLPGEVLAKLYCKYGDRLLEQNVRTFLQFRGKVNKGIRNTIVNESSMFFAYNNGLSATGEEVEVSRDGLRILRVKNLQIVNGGQTTASIFTAWHKEKVDLSKIYVQVKLSVVNGERVNEIVPKISEYANTQNKVNAADFFSNHPFHLRIEEFSRRIWAPAMDGGVRQTHWFYERARGQYMNAQANLTSAGTRKFLSQNPKAQMFTKTDLAKVVLSFDGRPHIVSHGAQKAFSGFGNQKGFVSYISELWERKQNIFNERWFKQSIAKTIFFRDLDRLLRRDSWFADKGSYKANIITYTLAKFSDIVRQKNKYINFEKEIWNTQKIPESLANTLVSLAKEVAELLLNPPAGATVNTGEWAKKEACWQRIQQEDLRLANSIDEYLIDSEEDSCEARGAIREHRVLKGIEAQTYVVNKGIVYWTQLREWNNNTRKLGYKTMGILEWVIQGKPPSEKQANVLIEAEKRAKSEGFYPVI